METRVRTLVVEDDRATRMLLEDWVRTRPELELCPWSAADGEEGMRLIRDWQPQLVLLDLIMPQCSGISLLRELERDPPPVRPRILVLSKVGSELIVDQVLSMGVDFYLRKPVNLSELGNLVDLLICRIPRQEPVLRGQAWEILAEMGAQSEWKGSLCAALAAECLAGHIGERLMKELYYAAIRESGGTYQSVDKNIRDLVHQLHQKGAASYQRIVKSDTRPSNRAFLRAVAREIERRTGLKSSES